jgi:uncharacterized membrane protein
VHITLGAVPWDYAAVLFVTGFTVTLVGQLLMYHIIAKTGRRSMIVLAMAVLLTSGAAIMVYETGLVIADAAHHGWLRASSLCVCVRLTEHHLCTCKHRVRKTTSWNQWSCGHACLHAL